MATGVLKKNGDCHIIIIYKLFLCCLHAQIDEDLSARLNMADYRFSFHERNKEYSPAWLAPEGFKNNCHNLCNVAILEDLLSEIPLVSKSIKAKNIFLC